MTMHSNQERYRRDLGLTEAAAIVIGRIIGSGIFATPALIMALAMSTSLFTLTWVIGGIVTIFAAVIYAELVAMIPKAGGPYVYLKEAYPPVWSFLRGWAMFFVSETAAIVAVALVFAHYTIALLTTMGASEFLLTWLLGINGVGTIITALMNLSWISLRDILLLLMVLTAIWSMTLANCFGVALSGRIQTFFSVVKFIILGLIIGFAFTSSHGSFSHFSQPFLPDEWGWAQFLALGAGLRYAFFAFSGWEGSTYVAEEVKNPGKNLPLALFFGISGVMLLYIGVNSAYIYMLPPHILQNSPSVATDAMNMAIGSIGGIFISLGIMISTFGNVSTQILVKSRTWHAMARDGMFFTFFKGIHSTYGTPNNALVGQAAWATVLLLFAVLGGNAYSTMIAFFSATSTIFNIMTFYSIVILRKKYPHMDRPYRAWLYPFSLWVILLIYSMFFIVTLITAFIPSLIGLGLTSTGLIYYYLVVKKRIDL